MLETDVVIVGAGLCGLRLATILQDKAISCVVIEARSRVGGRAKTCTTSDLKQSAVAGFDLGPAWFWPWQTRTRALISALKLDEAVFTQYSAGSSIIEYPSGEITRQANIASMEGSLRLSVGMQGLAERMGVSLQSNSLLLNHRVNLLSNESERVCLTLSSDTSKSLSSNDSIQKVVARKVILAMPPRIVSRTIEFQPALSNDIHQLMLNTPTWMAGQAKVVVRYRKPFWREAGLSGDAVSQRGPLVEIHDASADEGEPYGLFGFVGVQAASRKNQEEPLKRAAVSQLSRLFGIKEPPIDVYYKDWAFDNLTAINIDASEPGAHPHQEPQFPSLWDGRLFLAGSETASVQAQENGYIEGALASAERVARAVVTDA